MKSNFLYPGEPITRVFGVELGVIANLIAAFEEKTGEELYKLTAGEALVAIRVANRGT